MINEKQNEKWIKINHSEIVEIHILILAYFHICIIIFFLLKMLRKLYIIYTCIHISGSWTFPVLFINKPLVKRKMKIIFNFFCRWLNISFNMKTSWHCTVPTFIKWTWIVSPWKQELSPFEKGTGDCRSSFVAPLKKIKYIWQEDFYLPLLRETSSSKWRWPNVWISFILLIIRTWPYK